MRFAFVAMTCGAVLALQAVHAQQPAGPSWNGSYSSAQAARGEALYGENCASCHGKDLAGGPLAPPAGGPALLTRWQNRPMRELFDYVQTRMPYNGPGGLSHAQNADILGFMLRESKVPPGPNDYVPEDRSDLATAGRGEAFYTEDQAARGAFAFNRNCARCHSSTPAKLTVEQVSLSSTPRSFAAPFFQRIHHGKMIYPTVYHLFTKLQSMPAFDTESISDNTRADIIAHLLQRNGFPAGKSELRPDLDAMKEMMLNEPGFEHIFNRRDFTGIRFMLGSDCHPQPQGCGKTDPGDVIKIENGRMVCKCNIHSYWYTEKQYMNFTLRFQHKFIKPLGWEGDEDLYMGGGGWLLFIRDDFRVNPKSIEVEGRVRDMGMIFFIKGERGQFTYDNAAKTKVVKPFDWNDIEIVSKDGQVRSYVNGVLMSTVTQHNYQAGHIGFQMEGSPTEWRNIRLRVE